MQFFSNKPHYWLAFYTPPDPEIEKKYQILETEKRQNDNKKANQWLWYTQETRREVSKTPQKSLLKMPAPTNKQTNKTNNFAIQQPDCFFLSIHFFWK